MTRRMMDSSILSNMNFGVLPACVQVLQMLMILIADDQGRLSAHPLYLAKEIFRYAHVEPIDITKWLEQLQENGTILLYTVEGKPYAQFVNWWQYQALQFAHPSKHPRPEGWQDRLRFNSKGNQMLVCNWTTPKGEPMVDTCDQDGKPIPFVMELPVKKTSAEAAPEVPAQAPTEVPTQVATKVRTQVPAIAPAEVATKVGVKQPPLNLTNDQLMINQTTTTTTTARPLLTFALPLLLPEWNGGGVYLQSLTDEQLSIVCSWLWLWKKLKRKDKYSYNAYVDAYRPDPFTGIENPVGFIRVKVKEGAPAPLQEKHRGEFERELSKLPVQS